MAISRFTEQRLAYALGSEQLAQGVVAVIDADGGTLDVAEEQAIKSAVCDGIIGQQIVTAINADSALGELARIKLGVALGSQIAASEIGTELGS